MKEKETNPIIIRDAEIKNVGFTELLANGDYTSGKLINCTSQDFLGANLDFEIMDSQLRSYAVENQDLETPAKKRTEVIVTNSKIDDFKTYADTIGWAGDNTDFERVYVQGHMTFAAGSRATDVVIGEYGTAMVKDGAHIKRLEVRGTVCLDNCFVNYLIIYPGGRVTKYGNAAVSSISGSGLPSRNLYTEHHIIRRNNSTIGTDYICG